MTVVGFVILFASASVPAGNDYPTAGSTPDRRPENAPVITDVNKGADWYEQALTGVSRPYPRSFRFLEDQGNWHTPFNRPGMTGGYDIRGWHKKAPAR